MFGTYQMNTQRIISSANQNLYVSGTLHPDRIMAEHDLVYILEGEWEIYQNETAYKLFPDDVIFLHAGQHHYGLQPCAPYTSTMFIHVNNDMGDHFFPTSHQPGQFMIPTITHCQDIFSVKTLFREIITTFWSSAPHKDIKTSLLFQLLLYELSNCANNKDSLEMHICEKVVQLFYSNPQTFFSAKELAAQMHLSERTLRNQFKKQHHQTLYQYQLNFKLQNVCAYLQEYPRMTLHEIASNLGFYDEFHLSRLFKKKYGISPREYKKKMKEQNQRAYSVSSEYTEFFPGKPPVQAKDAPTRIR